MGKATELSVEDLRREYLEKDVSMREACEALRCCATTLIKALRRHGLPTKPRTWNHRRKNRFPQLQDRNWLMEQMATRSMQDIARELGTSQGNVSDHAKRHGIRSRFHDRSAATVAGLKKRWPNGRGGTEAANWRGGRIKAGGGHIYLYKPDHPNANLKGYVMEHRVVVEEHLGRLLEKEEVVHHRNGIKTDNRIENLEVMTVTEHRREHMDAHAHLHEARERIATLETFIRSLGHEPPH